MVFVLPPLLRRLVAAGALLLAAGHATAGLQDLLEKAASTEAPSRPTAIADFLDALQNPGNRPPAEQLRYAWYGYFLAETDAEKLKVIEIAARIPSPDARMILFGLTDTAAVEKQVIAGQKALDQLLVNFPEVKKDKAGRLSFGKNPFDRMPDYEVFVPPRFWVGRWSGEGVEMDLNAFPSKTIAGRIRSEETGEARVVGWDERNPQIFGPGWKAVWQGGHFLLTGHGRENALLKRMAVGKTGKTPPSGATMLFNGKDMKAWAEKNEADAAWKITPEGWLEIPPGVGDHHTRESFGDVRFYMEYRQAFNPEGINRKRGNSGLYLQSNYEIQLTDNFANDVNEALSGAIYHIAPPLVNASAPPMEWQSLEVEFFAPRFDAAGTKITNARMSVWQNGVKIHDNVELPKITGGGRGEVPGPLPVNLQAHGGLLQFRNIWAQPLSAGAPSVK